MMKIFDLSL